jgi:hypothetical protein
MTSRSRRSRKGDSMAPNSKYRGGINADYGSHIPILAAAVVEASRCGRSGDVLELGCGDSSTPMLHYMCRALKVPLVTLDTDMKWMERFGDYFRPPSSGAMHLFTHVRDWETQVLDVLDMEWGVVFVDCAPGDARYKLIRRLAHKATFIVAHDSERDHGTGANYEYEKVTPLFKHVSEFRRFRPYTLVLSNSEPFEIEETDKVWYHPEVAE